jgi:hypothetical protein
MSSFYSSTECEVFTYTKGEMIKTIMPYFYIIKDFSLKNLIDEKFDYISKNVRKNIYKRILKYKIDGDFWGETEQSDSLTTELTIIWKLAVIVFKEFIKQTEGGIDGENFRYLEKIEEDLKNNKINEQEYITYCNNLKLKKEVEEELFNVCICSVLGVVNDCWTGNNGETKIRSMCIRIMCLPCGWCNGSLIRPHL